MASTPKTEADPEAQDPGKADLEMLFRSALVSALDFKLDPDNRNEAKNPKRETEYRALVLERMKDECKKIDVLGQNIRDGSRRAYTVARAVMKNAYGSALFHQGQPRDAEVELRDAITLMPDFVDAYLNLAEVLMKAKSTLDSNWIQEAQDQLYQALLLSPSSQRAHYLLGKLLADPAIGDFAHAREHLSKAELIPMSYLVLGEISKDQDGDLNQAIQTLGKSIARFPRVDYRYEAYVRWIKMLVEAKAATAESNPSLVQSFVTLLARGLAAARKLETQGINEVQKAKGTELVNTLSALRDKICPPKTNAEEDGKAGDAGENKSPPA